jgi:Recombination, repair and ssDNA binding protein UvsY
VKCIPLEDLVTMWTDEDSIINKADAQLELLRIPTLHAKYAGQIAAHSASLKMKNFDYIQMKKQKWDWMNGRMDQAQLAALGWTQFKFLLKQDMNLYLDADPDLIKLQQKKINNEEAIEFCKSVTKELSNRTWQIRDYLAWEKFIAGQ